MRPGLLVLACLALAVIVLPGAMASNAHTSEVLLARRQWHVDIGFATANLDPALTPIARAFPDARYVFFGFGDMHYLLSKHHSVAMLGAVWPGRALILVTALANAPAQAFGADEVIAIPVDAETAESIQRFIFAAFDRASAQDTPSRYAAGPYDDSAYYLATARYSGWHTCNTWVAEALKAGGLPVHSGGVLFAGQLWRQVRRVASAEHSRGGEGVPAH